MNPTAKDPLDAKVLAIKCEELEKELAATQAELDAVQPELNRLKDLAARAQADLQNAKTRIEREAGETRKYATEGFIMKLLPTIDNFQRAFRHLPEELLSHDWVKGVASVEQQMMNELTAVGLQKMDCVGQAADPQKHEVLQAGPGEKDVITDVFEDGYELNGKVLRPAKVKVGDGS